MTVTAISYTPLTYNGNGATSVFNITFQFYEIAVIHIDGSGSETEWVENTHYILTGGEGSTGSITVITEDLPEPGEQVRIERRTSKDQPRDYDLDNEVLETALQQSDDRLVMILQEIDYDNRRRPAISTSNFTAEVEFPTAQTGSVLSWGSDGNLANTALVDLDGIAISALTATASLEDTDLLPLYDNNAGDNASISWGNVKTQVTTSLGALAIRDTVAADQIDDNAITLAKMEHGVAGDLFYYGASGVPSRLPKGADDQILSLVSGLPAWIGGGVAAGIMVEFGGATAPAGWLICDGAVVSRTTYADLFAAIGTAWGSGDGSTTFNLPDCRGRGGIGAGTGTGLTARSLGASGGEEAHTLSVAEMPSHTHSQSIRSTTTVDSGSKSGVASSSTTSTTTGSAGSNAAHNNMPPFYAANKIIKI